MEDRIARENANSPWLDYDGASALLKAEFNVDKAPLTIRNKVYAGEIPYSVIAGTRMIHRDKLRAWALGGEPVEPTVA